MNLPNKLTLTRLLMVPLLIAAMSLPGLPWRIVALLLFLTASATDALDGHIARDRHLVTNLGKFMDPLADKALVNATLIMMCAQGLVSPYPVIIMVIRDLAVDGLRLMLAKDGKVLAAGIGGKLKTVAQMAAIVALFLHEVLFTAFPLDQILLWVAVALSVYSGVSYLAANRAVFTESEGR